MDLVPTGDLLIITIDTDASNLLGLVGLMFSVAFLLYGFEVILAYTEL